MDQIYQTPPSYNPRRRKFFAIAVGAIIIAIVGMFAYIFRDTLTGLFSGAKPTAVFCKSRNPVGIPGMQLTFAALGGNGTFAWTVEGPATTTSGNSQGFATSYNTPGNYIITVESGGATDRCNVQIIPPAPDLDFGSITLNGNDGIYPYINNNALSIHCVAPLTTVRGQTFDLNTETRFSLANRGFLDAENIVVRLTQSGVGGAFDSVTTTSGTVAKISETEATWTIPKIIRGSWANITFTKDNVTAGNLSISAQVMQSTPLDFDRSGDDRATMGCSDTDYLDEPIGSNSSSSAARQSAATPAESAASEEPAAPAEEKTAEKVAVEEATPGAEPVDETPDPIDPIDIDPVTPPPAPQEVCEDAPSEAFLRANGVDYRILHNAVLVKNIGSKCFRFTLKGNDVVTGNLYPFGEQVLKQTKVFTVSAGTTVIITLDKAPLSCSFQTDLQMGDATGVNSGVISYDFMEHKCVPPPTGVLSCSPPTQTVAVGQPAVFTAANGSLPIWTAPNGQPVGGRGSNFQTTYSAEGTYTVVVQSNGLSASCTVVVGAGTGGQSVVCAPATQTIAVNGTANFTATGGSGNYVWSTTGDNPTKPPTGTSASFTYGAAGNYTVTVTDTGTPTNKPGTCAVIVSSTPPPPGQTLTCAPATQNAQVGASVSFTSTYSGQGLTYRWSAPGGTPDSGLADRFSTSYGSAGNKTVTVTVGGETATCAVVVTAGPPVVQTLVCAPASQTITAGGTASFTATGGSGNYVWSTTGDNPTKPPTGASAQFTYGAPGSYTVTVSDKGTPTNTPGTCAVTVNATLTEANADLAITKSVSNPTPQLNGEYFWYTIIISNLGPNNATGVSVRDVLPSGVTFVSIGEPATKPSPGASQGSYNVNDGIWTVGAINSGRDATLFLAARASSTGTHTNTATIIASSLPDAVQSNNEASVNITVTTGGGSSPSYDIAVTKAVSNSSPSLNQNTEYTITATNNGNSTATSVTLRDILPSSITHVSDTATVGSYNESTGIWTIGSMASGASATLHIAFTPNDTGTTTNTVTVNSLDQTDSNSSNNSASASFTVSSGGGGGGGGSSRADISVIKTVNNTSPQLNSTVTFAIRAFNNGPRDATDVEIRDVLPSGLTYVSHSASQGTYSQSTGIWVIGDIDDGDSETLTITATATQLGTIVNTAVVTDSSPNDPTSSNNQSSVTVTVGSGGGGSSGPDLAVTKTVSNALPAVGSQITYTINLVNLGSTTINSITIIDTLPSGLTFVKAQTTVGSYNKSNGIWTVGSLPSGGSAVLQLTVTVNKVGTIVNAARVNGSDPTDSNPLNNEGQVTITSHGAPGLPAAGLNNAAPIVIGFLFILLSIIVRFLGSVKPQPVYVGDRRRINSRTRFD